jgi:hypothetical protein
MMQPYRDRQRPPRAGRPLTRLFAAATRASVWFDPEADDGGFWPIEAFRSSRGRGLYWDCAQFVCAAKPACP